MSGNLNRFSVTVWTAACALAIGHLMQMADGRFSRAEAGVLRDEMRPAPSLPLKNIHLTAGHDENTGRAMATGDSADCPVTAQTELRPDAVVLLRLDAPCQKSERVNLHHSGLMFSEMTDADGRLNIEIPALARNAIIIAEFPNGAGAVARAIVDTIGDYDRVAVQWAGKSEFEIHALEFGAEYGGPGHVWSGSRDTNSVGQVVRLGNPNALLPRQAEVYTYPTGNPVRSGNIGLSIETEVTTSNCGREVNAQTLQTHVGGMLRTSDVVLSVPSCDTVGDYLVLNNVVDDLTVAQK